MQRTHWSLAAVTLALVIGACSGSESLSPAPSTDLEGGAGGTHHGDAAIVTGPSTPPQVPPVVASFSLSGTVYGREAGPDTTQVVGVPNVQVTLVKIAGVTGDTLVPSVTVTSTSTDASGAYRVANLAPAYYRIDVTAPAGSPYTNGGSGIGPARQTEITLNISLARKP
ncbi:MAG TPA: hypothetical protein VGJ18_26395 [Gemmatimonadaceae bacterium]|jgi:hypothetical protein